MRMEDATQPLQFSEDPDQEHQRILQAKTRAAMGSWEVGARLLRMRETQDWKKVTVGGPYESWTDYMRRGCGVEVSTCMLYMQAAELPLWVTLKYGVTNAGVLSRIMDVTQAEETAEEAEKLLLPTDDGTPKTYEAMTYEERKRALTLLSEELGVARQGLRPKTPARTTTTAVRDQIRQSAEGLLKPGQVTSREVGGNFFIDLKGIPAERAVEILTALAAKLRS